MVNGRPSRIASIGHRLQAAADAMPRPDGVTMTHSNDPDRWWIRMRAALLALGLALAAADGSADTIDHSRAYQACMALSRSDPDAGFENALAWHDRGGGLAARHCAAVALIGLGHHRQAAERLEALAAELGGQPELRAGVLAQAAQGWLMAGETERAYAVQSAALELAPDDPELLVDRSATLAEAGRYWAAIDDLNRALEIDPQRVEALVFRASAYRMVDALPLAADDLARALALRPGDPEALLERGIVRRLSQDEAGARADWLEVLRRADGTPAAAAARANLEKLDVKVE
jgi:tetratricopeptide (TPR) repeat protein